eukprot:270178-Prymnesium_polylepis.1
MVAATMRVERAPPPTAADGAPLELAGSAASLPLSEGDASSYAALGAAVAALAVTEPGAHTEGELAAVVGRARAASGPQQTLGASHGLMHRVKSRMRKMLRMSVGGGRSCKSI